MEEKGANVKRKSEKRKPHTHTHTQAHTHPSKMYKIRFVSPERLLFLQSNVIECDRIYKFVKFLMNLTV